ncbi:hypothetical protein EXIGLDRAFT_440117 [Exidia glandulosa HHB12029]|uniref:Extracellular membrane protein CFEM domain-containing protein n=1 Tax=Exidia glandulosa HHB12029 TaxID=1314781 RepID=A0A165B7P0_EXIGL|nr:hypothetical protein EXIGLDRAFT_440117 [Exidia glandulosa HHB12029]
MRWFLSTTLALGASSLAVAASTSMSSIQVPISSRAVACIQTCNDRVNSGETWPCDKVGACTGKCSKSSFTEQLSLCFASEKSCDAFAQVASSVLMLMCDACSTATSCCKLKYVASDLVTHCLNSDFHGCRQPPHQRPVGRYCITRLALPSATATVEQGSPASVRRAAHIPRRSERHRPGRHVPTPNDSEAPPDRSTYSALYVPERAENGLLSTGGLVVDWLQSTYDVVPRKR